MVRTPSRKPILDAIFAELVLGISKAKEMLLPTPSTVLSREENDDITTKMVANQGYVALPQDE